MEDNKKQLAEAGGISPIKRDVGFVNAVEASGFAQFQSQLFDGTEAQQLAAMVTLAHLSYLNVNNKMLVEQTTLSGLVARVREGRPIQRKYATCTLNTLALKDDRIKRLIIDASEIVSLLSRIRGSGSGTEREQALISLERLAGVSVNAHAIVAADGVVTLLFVVRHGREVEDQHAANVLNQVARLDDQATPLIALASGIDELFALVLDSADATQRDQAATSLNRLRRVKDNRKRITQASGIHNLLSLIGSGTHGQKECAARTLDRLACVGDNRQAIVEAGGIAPLVALILDGTDAQRTHAANAINTVASLYRVRTRIPEESGIPQLVALVIEGTDTQRRRAAFSLDRLALVHLNKTSIATTSCIQNLISNVRHGNAAQQQQALPLMANIAFITHNRTLIVKSGVIRSLVALAVAQETLQATRASAVQVLAVLALSEESHQPIAAANGIVALVKLLLRETGSAGCHKSAVLCLWRLAQNSKIAVRIVDAGGKKAIQKIVTEGREEVQAIAIKTLELLRNIEGTSSWWRRLFH